MMKPLMTKKMSTPEREQVEPLRAPADPEQVIGQHHQHRYTAQY
jgi:hypothetical protein